MNGAATGIPPGAHRVTGDLEAPHQPRVAWLCFTDHDRAVQDFSPGTTTRATVTVSGFTIHYHPSDVYDTAVLDGVVSRVS